MGKLQYAVDVARNLIARSTRVHFWTAYYVLWALLSISLIGPASTIEVAFYVGGILLLWRNADAIGRWLYGCYNRAFNAVLALGEKVKPAAEALRATAVSKFNAFIAAWTEPWKQSLATAAIVQKARKMVSAAQQSLFAAQEDEALAELEARRLAREFGAAAENLENAYLDGEAFSVRRQQKREALERVRGQQDVVKAAWRATDEADSALVAALTELEQAKEALRRR